MLPALPQTSSSHCSPSAAASARLPFGRSVLLSAWPEARISHESVPAAPRRPAHELQDRRCPASEHPLSIPKFACGATMGRAVGEPDWSSSLAGGGRPFANTRCANRQNPPESAVPPHLCPITLIALNLTFSYSCLTPVLVSAKGGIIFGTRHQPHSVVSIGRDFARERGNQTAVAHTSEALRFPTEPTAK